MNLFPCLAPERQVAEGVEVRWTGLSKHPLKDALPIPP